MPKKRIVILGTLDTKEKELAFIDHYLRQAGHPTAMLDLSTKGKPQCTPDIPAAQVAKAGGAKLEQLQKSKDTAAVSQVMIEGAAKILGQMMDQGKVAGVISVGGASGTTMATRIMQKLPFGLPKVMVSSTAAMPQYAGHYFGTKDLTIFHSVVDLAGLNSLAQDVLLRAAGCIAGMVSAVNNHGSPLSGEKKSLRVAMTQFKFSAECCRLVQEQLTGLGMEVIAYHAQGIGDRAMEEAISQGLYDGVVDIVPAGLAEEMLGGNRAAGKERLEAAGKRGIPQVIAPSGFDMLSCGPLQRKQANDPLWATRHLAQRKLFIPDAYRVQARINGSELRQVARALAWKINQARGPVEVVVPLAGWSSLSETGGPLWDQEADQAFLEELQLHLAEHIGLTLVPAPLNSQEFALAVVEKFCSMLRTSSLQQGAN